ncbi:MAG: TM0106 family RecB-like putative nuclease [Micrococcales bacterium]|nr:TM0106 family RecB-like putative nuclease [Micrococcales bacterium]
MFFFDGEQRATVSPTDLRSAGECEFALLRRFDEVLGRAQAAPAVADPMLERTLELGLAHEQEALRSLVARHRGHVVEVSRPQRTRAAYASAHETTLDALRDPATEVVYQGVIAGERFIGIADFLVREGDSWTVCDSKLARSASVPALLQIAAYAAQLRSAGIPVSPSARLILGSGEQRDFPLDEIVPVERARRARLLAMLDRHQDEGGAVSWEDERWAACGRCDDCQAELAARRDVALVGGVHTSQRQRLLAAGVTTVEELAERTDPVPDLPETRLAALRAQARLQLRGEQANADGAGHQVLSEVHTPEALAVLPPPSEGDIFFDFEGDPMWSEAGSSVWGLEYLFGALTHDGGPETFTPFWAHDRDEERVALRAFLDWVAERRRRWPDLHIYHYAAYERSALLRLAVRHSTGEEEVDQLLRDGVLVDLYAVVRSAVRVSERSYSIKRLEPIYMGEDLRAGDVTTAADSIVEYHRYSQARIEGRTDEAAGLLEEIRAYNEYDCLSTLRLRDWLLEQANEAGVVSAIGTRTGEEEPAALSESAQQLVDLELQLRALIGEVRATERTTDQQALAMAAATLQFHRRENKPHWWAHFDRMRLPVSEWQRGADLFAVESGAVDDPGWHRPPKKRVDRRTVRLRGRFPGGGAYTRGDSLIAVYRDPWPEGMDHQPEHVHAAKGTVTVVEVAEVDDGRHEVVIEETLGKGMPQHDQLPCGLMPGSPLMTKSIDDALRDLGQEVNDVWPALPEQPGVDLLRRIPPRLLRGPGLPEVGAGPERFVDAIEAAVRDLDSSYLAVQGPPGTGKTYVGSRVIARLVEAGWKVGVCAQSHAAIENVLSACVRAGVPGSGVGKEITESGRTPQWTVTGKDRLAAFAAEQPGGYVIGGTAWDLTNPKRVEREQLDLLVIDEAGQFSLAKTVAVSVSASRLLLLGDPQQLPQVSQGSHPEPVDESALGWLLRGEPVMPPGLGYFLATTWRMHPALADRVSRLSYAGSLAAEEQATAARRLDGIEPGVHLVTVEHRHNTQSSPEEAERVVSLARELIGTLWDDPDDQDESGAPIGARPLTAADIVVVTPYNRQAGLLRRVLDEAGLADTQVGTVDRFQGREAAVVILSMAASAREDVSRGMGFLLDRHRLNVSISRGKWAAYVVCSNVLTDFVPSSPRELLALGAFMHLVGEA